MLKFSILEGMNAILKVNSRGTLTLPKPLRKLLGISEGGMLMYSFREGNVTLQPAETYPIEIYTDERIAEFKEDEEAIGDRIDKLLEKKGLVYDPVTWTIREKGTPYLKQKGKKKK